MRTERAVDRVPNTVTIQRAQQLEATGARDLKDALRNEVDVTVPASAVRFSAALSAAGRPGNSGINIRGLEGNQVLMMVDGIRIPNAFAFSAFSTGRADYFETDALSSLEVLRGPASTQYGSDGLAGALTLNTLSPDEVLHGKPFAGFGRASYAEIDDSTATTAALAHSGGGSFRQLLLVTHREGGETENRGDRGGVGAQRTEPNPIDTRSDYLLGKLAWRLAGGHELGTTFETRRRALRYDVLSAQGPNTASLLADDDIQRDRISLEHRFDDPNARLFQKVQNHLYLQDSETRQFTAEDRIMLTTPDRTRDNTYAERLVGFTTLAQSQLAMQRLSYGADLSRAEITGLRDGTVAPPGDPFPSKPFPDTHYTLAGAFVQSEIDAGDWAFIPALRFDAYKLEPSSLDGFLLIGGAPPPATLSDHAFTPRIGALWRLSERFSPYGQWSQGFRSPTPEQVNNGFQNTTAFYRTIGNPNLKPEHANSIELGFRGAHEGWRWQVAAYDNRYRDFIEESVHVSGPPPGEAVDNDNPTAFQSINLERARIRGLELRTDWAAAPGWTVKFRAAVAKGDSTEGDGSTQPLNSVMPARTSLEVQRSRGPWTLSATWLHSEGKDDGEVNFVESPEAFLPPSYDVLDLSASWQATRTVRLVANVSNVGDVKYWRWTDMRGVTAASPGLDGFTAPGLNLQFALRADF